MLLKECIIQKLPIDKSPKSVNRRCNSHNKLISVKITKQCLYYLSLSVMRMKTCPSPIFHHHMVLACCLQRGGGHAISMQPTTQKDKMYRFTNL
jgi:hypothetical protein